VELDRDGSAGAQAVGAGLDQAPVRIEAVAGGEHRFARLARQFGEAPGIGGRQVRKVRDDEVDLARDGVEKIAQANGDPVLEGVRRDVRARDGDGVRARVRGPDLDLRRGRRDRDRHGARAGADVDDLRRPAAYERERRSNELLAGGPRAHHSTGGSQERQPVEGRLGHA